MAKIVLSNMADNRVVMPTNIFTNDRNRKRIVAFYGRVSTEHEAQLAALENQLQWYDDQAKYHPNWTVLRKYIDEGITGTQAKKRPSFMEMIEDAKQHKFDLIVTREVCRFARNTVDTLVVTRELKEYGVEVYFVEDNIWTMDGDGELRLSLMATLAQEESRKTSERVRAGQKISRDNGVLYGNGNILGYDRDNLHSTYVINEEQAETVRIIYNLYLNGYGFQKIVNELVRLKRKDASGLVRWECTKVSRILHNATYKGYIGYLKSYKNNYLDQKTIINHDEDTYLYVKGNFEPIISEEVWDRCKEIRESKRGKCQHKNGAEVTNGVRRSDDIWVKKMICRCGYHFRKDKWHFNKTGVTFGYKCYNQLNNGSKQARIDAGLPSEKYCDMGAVADWKIEMMVWHIFNRINPITADVINEAYKIYQQCSVDKPQDSRALILEREAKLNKAKRKIDNLTEMRIGGEITKEEYQSYRTKIDIEIIKLEQELAELRTQPTSKAETVIETITFDEFKQLLTDEVDLSKPMIERSVIDKIVQKIIPNTSQDFKWYLNLLPHKSNEDYSEVLCFTIKFAEARDYRKMRGEMLRENQWRDLVVRILI